MMEAVLFIPQWEEGGGGWEASNSLDSCFLEPIYFYILFCIHLTLFLWIRINGFTLKVLGLDRF